MKKLRKKQIIIIASVLGAIIIGLITFSLLNNNKEVVTKKSGDTEIKLDETIDIVDVNSTSRPYAVMVENSSTARPYHSGLQDTYIIYEIIVEGGISRYLALFRDAEPERISGIRSSRHYYLDYAMENDAYYIHWGASPYARSDLNSLNIDSYEVASNHYAFYDYSLPVSSENSTYTSMAQLKTAIATTNYRDELNVDLLLDYSANSIELNSIEGSKKTVTVDIYYSSSNISGFIYDEETKSYLHDVNKVAHTDYITGEQYTFKNIITYQVENYTMPGEETRQEIENIGSGTGYYISEGYSIPIKWSKSSRESQTIYTTLDGEELIVNDGNTFIAIQPAGQTINLGE